MDVGVLCEDPGDQYFLGGVMSMSRAAWAIISTACFVGVSGVSGGDNERSETDGDGRYGLVIVPSYRCLMGVTRMEDVVECG